MGFGRCSPEELKRSPNLCFAKGWIAFSVLVIQIRPKTLCFGRGGAGPSFGPAEAHPPILKLALKHMQRVLTWDQPGKYAGLWNLSSHKRKTTKERPPSDEAQGNVAAMLVCLTSVAEVPRLFLHHNIHIYIYIYIYVHGIPYNVAVACMLLARFLAPSLACSLACLLASWLAHLLAGFLASSRPCLLAGSLASSVASWAA